MTQLSTRNAPALPVILPRELEVTTVHQMEPFERKWILACRIHVDAQGRMFVDAESRVGSLNQSGSDVFDVVEIRRVENGVELRIPEHLRFSRELYFNQRFLYPVVKVEVVE